MFGENETTSTTQEQVKKQKTIGQLAKQIDKKEKEIAQLKAKLQKAQNEIDKLKKELMELL